MNMQIKTLINQSIIQLHIEHCPHQYNYYKIVRIALLLKKRRITRIKWKQESINNKSPEYVNDEITYNRDATTWTLRNADDFRLPIYKKTYIQHSMWYDGPNIFNKLAPTIGDEALQRSSLACQGLINWHVPFINVFVKDSTSCAL
jgi:hypothetical protein